MLILVIAAWFPLTASEESCSTRNFAFKEGENIFFNVYYSVIGLYVNAGSANFSLSLEKLNNKPVYHVVGKGSSNPSYDWIFKVRDTYESYFDTATLRPYKFIRNVDEGGFKLKEDVTFNQQTNTAVTTKGTYSVTNCIQDVLSAIYYARNIDYSSYKPEDKIPFDMFLDNETYHLYIKYLGKEDIKTKYGKFHAIKFKPLLIKGTMFEGGEKMVVWVSDDANHIPLRIESPIVVGSVKVDMMSYSNLRYPLSSMIEKK
ncbi:MAG: DUF3108 domain-containing protein [Sphingobacteriia bacterium]|nr:DUF3108 domain-containing protein [Sphingobacteriia bacterium]